MSLPHLLLLSDLLRHRVRCDQGLERGPGCAVWMHPPVHRVLGWVSRPSQFGRDRLVWRLDQLRGLTPQEAFVKGEGSLTDPDTLERLPTLLDATLLAGDGQALGTVADCSFRCGDGRIEEYLVSRSDPRLPGSSRWRLRPERILDQQPGRVITNLRGLDDLPLARASVREELLRRSRRWRDRIDEETGRVRERVQDLGSRAGDRLEGWLDEEAPFEADDLRDREAPPRAGPDVWDDWLDAEEPPAEPVPRRRRGPPDRSQDAGWPEDGDPWL